jgi:hypothetical protein
MNASFRGGTAFLYLGENFTLPLKRCRPGIKVPSRKEDKKMFQGTTIEELINSVARAEEHARQQEESSVSPRFARVGTEYPLRRMEWRKPETVGVA